MKRLTLILILCVLTLLSACAPDLPQSATPQEGTFYATYDILAQNNRLSNVYDLVGTEASIAIFTVDTQRVRLVQINLAEEKPEIQGEITTQLTGMVEQMSIVADGAIWLAIQEEEVSKVEEEELIVYSRKICRIDSQGALLNTFDLPENVIPSQLEAITDEAGIEKICIQTEDAILLYDIQGRQLVSMPHKGSVFFAGDGRLMAWSGASRILAVLDSGNLSIQNSYDLTGMRINEIFPGDQETPLYVGNEQGIYGIDLDKLVLIPRISYIQSGLTDITICSIIRRDHGDYSILAVEGGREPFGVWRLQTVENYEALHGKGSFPQKETILLATFMNTREITHLVTRFNRQNAQYQVVIKDYSMVAAGGDWKAGMEALAQDMTTGVVPDILDMSGLSPESLVQKNLFVDLKPLIQEDSVLTEEMFLSSIMQGHETDGKLLMISPFFAINTLVGKKSVMGGVEGWSAAEAQAFSQSIPSGSLFGDLTGAMVAEEYATNSASAYIDWKTGTCRFDSEDFIQALEWIASFPKDAPYARMQGGDPLRIAQFLDDLRQDRFYLARMFVTSAWSVPTTNALLGEQSCFVDTPGHPGATAAVVATYGILKDSAHIQGAWAFLRQLLLPEYGAVNNMFYLPVNREALDARLQRALTPPEEPEENVGIDIDVVPDESTEDETDKTTDFNALIRAGDGYILETDLLPAQKPEEKRVLEPEEAEQFMALLDSITRVNFVDMHVNGVVTEEIDVFLGGGRTAAETAQIIQTRVSLYLSEQYRP